MKERSESGSVSNGNLMTAVGTFQVSIFVMLLINVLSQYACVYGVFYLTGTWFRCGLGADAGDHVGNVSRFDQFAHLLDGHHTTQVSEFGVEHHVLSEPVWS